MTKIFLSTQVEAFRGGLHPEHRRAFKRALVDLAAGRGDLAPLYDELDGFYRLRVGDVRIVFRYEQNGVIRCRFAERRKFVYELLRANPARLLDE